MKLGYLLIIVALVALGVYGLNKNPTLSVILLGVAFILAMFRMEILGYIEDKVNE